VVRIDVTQAGQQSVRLSVTVDPEPSHLEKPGPAAALLHELIERAKTVMRQSNEPRRQEVKGRLDEIEKRRAELRATIEVLCKQVRIAERGRMATVDPAAQPGSSSRSWRPSGRDSVRSRKYCLRLAKENDELGKALQGLVAAREALVAGLEKAVEQGRPTGWSLLRARADLAEARVRTAEETAARSSSQSRSVRDEAVNSKFDIAAIEAQLKALPRARRRACQVRRRGRPATRNDLMRAETRTAIWRRNINRPGATSTSSRRPRPSSFSTASNGNGARTGPAWLVEKHRGASLSEGCAPAFFVPRAHRQGIADWCLSTLEINAQSLAEYSVKPRPP